MAIDKAKGIIANPMPKEWYDWRTVKGIENEKERSLYENIVAEKKPYFMRYIYPSLMKEYNTYIKNTNKNAVREFGVTVDEMSVLPYEKPLTEEQIKFLDEYEKHMPVGVGNCTMNYICRIFEDSFDGYTFKNKGVFDYNLFKSEAEYTTSQFYAVKKIYEEYCKHLKMYKIFANNENISKDDLECDLSVMRDTFRRKCENVVSNEEILCNIILDLCYKSNSTKRFAWDICGDTIIQNLLSKNDNTISFPVADKNGDISYCGNYYTLKSKKVGGE